MTKDLLMCDAKEYAHKACAWLEDREPLDEQDIINAYLAGAEPKTEKLIKAKNIITLLIEASRKADPNFTPIVINQAKEFLKEVEK